MSWKHYLVVWWKLQLMYWEAPCCSGWRTHSGSTFYINIVEYLPVFILRCPSFLWKTQLDQTWSSLPCDDPKWIECIPCHSTWNTFIVTSSLGVYVRPWSTPGMDVGYLSDRGTFISLGHTWSIYRVSMEHFKYSMLKGWRSRDRCHTWNEEGVNAVWMQCD